jgi:hypothetical protein
VSEIQAQEQENNLIKASNRNSVLQPQVKPRAVLDENGFGEEERKVSTKGNILSNLYRIPTFLFLQQDYKYHVTKSNII